ncbi:MAG: TonB-dependent receptor [Croceibacterium sp.]
MDHEGTRWLRGALRGGASLFAVGTLLATNAAYAQDSDTTAETEPTEVTEENEILVTGIRQSLANSQDIKRDADTVVDAITAEDIGALPDRSVTEALQRVPGIAINRFAGSNDPDHFSVEGSGVVVRGLNFVRSKFNGRTAFAAGVGGQALNFADVPSELLGSVIINKNATAEMIEGGLAGTVNLNTRKPFDRDGFHIAFSAEANYGDLRKEWTPTFSGLISNTWDTDAGRFGILVSGAFSQIKSRSDGLQIANYQTRDGMMVNAANTGGGTQTCRNPLPSGENTRILPPGGSACGNFGTAGVDTWADYASYRVAPVGGQFRTQEFNRKRDGIAAAAQWESLDEGTRVTFDFIRSHTTNAWGEYTFETAPDLAEYSTYPLGCRQNANGPATSTGGTTSRAECPVGGFTDYTYDENGLFQSGYIVNTSNGWRGGTNNYDPGIGGGSPYVAIGGLQQSLARRQVLDEVTNTDYGLNIVSKLSERLTADVDVHYAKSRKENLDVSVFGSVFADQELDISGEYPVVIPHKPQFLGYTWSAPSPALGSATEAEYFTDPRFQFWRAAMDHIEDSEGEQLALRGDLDYEFDDDAFIRRVKVGARFQERDQTVRYTTYNWGMLSETWSGSRPINFEDVPGERYEFDNFFRGQTPPPPGGWYYDGNLTDDYDGAVADFQAIQAMARQYGSNPSWNPLAARPTAIAGSPYIPADIQPVSQEDTALYIMASFGSDELFGGVRMSGNIGVRYVDTAIRSEGSVGIPSQAQLNILDPYDIRCPLTVPPGAPPGTPATRPGGVCQLGAQGYANLQTFAGSGTSVTDVARAEYDYWLPSLNLRFGLSDDLILRFAGSKVLTRPDNSYIRNFLTTGLGTSGELTASTGNPFIRPATAWQFDASLEWYFARVGSLTLNGFYKAIDNFFYQNVFERAVTSNGITQNVLVRGPDNFDGTGKIKGFEVAYQQTYEFLPAPFDGLGVQANYTFIDSSGLPNSFLNTGAPVNNSTVAPGNLPLEQLSKHNYNVAAFYEKGPISVRAAYNWRSRFLLTAADVIFPYYSIFNEPTGQLDASLFFNINDRLRVGVQGVNLLNEVTKTTQAYTGNPDQLAPRSYFMNDRRFSFIVRGNF